MNAECKSNPFPAMISGAHSLVYSVDELSFRSASFRFSLIESFISWPFVVTRITMYIFFFTKEA